MSGYLTRLVSRAQGTDEVRSMQPIVRSASPIAERDQRIGMTGFEGVEFGGPSIIDAGSDASDREQGDALQRSASSSITGISDIGEPAVQRKVVNVTAASTGLMNKNQVLRPGLGQSDAPVSSEVFKVTPQNPQPASSDSDGGTVPHTETHSDSVRHLGVTTADPPPTSAVGTSSVGAPGNIAVDLQAGISSKKALPAEIANSDPAQPDVPLHQVNCGSVHARSAWQSHQVDTPYLEPLPRVNAEYVGPTSADTDTPLSGVAENPRVLIERVNVEVVSPSEAQANTATQAGPLTAASVSVIGPLDGRVPVSRRLSFRYR